MPLEKIDSVEYHRRVTLLVLPIDFAESIKTPDLSVCEFFTLNKYVVDT